MLPVHRFWPIPASCFTCFYRLFRTRWMPWKRPAGANWSFLLAPASRRCAFSFRIRGQASSIQNARLNPSSPQSRSGREQAWGSAHVMASFASMRATLLAATVWRGERTSQFLFPRLRWLSGNPVLQSRLFRSRQDETATSPQAPTGNCRGDFCLASGRRGVRQALIPVDHVRRRAPLRIAGSGDSGGSRKFPFSSRGFAAVLEIDGRGAVSNAAFASLLVLLRLPPPLLHSQPGYRRYALPAGARFLSFCFCVAAALGVSGRRYAASALGFCAAHILVDDPLWIFCAPLANRDPGLRQIRPNLLSDRADSAPDDHRGPGGGVETQRWAMAYVLRQLHLPVCADSWGESAAERGH